MQHRSEPRTGRHGLEDQMADSGFLESAEVDSHRLSGPSAALCLTLELGSEPQAPLMEHWFPGGEILLPKPVQQSFPASGSFPMSQSSGGQSIGASASASVLPMSVQG